MKIGWVCYFCLILLNKHINKRRWNHNLLGGTKYDDDDDYESVLDCNEAYVLHPVMAFLTVFWDTVSRSCVCVCVRMMQLVWSWQDEAGTVCCDSVLLSGVRLLSKPVQLESGNDRPVAMEQYFRLWPGQSARVCRAVLRKVCNFWLIKGRIAVKRRTACIVFFTHRPKTSIFSPPGRFVAPIHVKFGTAERPEHVIEPLIDF